MRIRIEPIAQLTQRAIDALVHELGIVDALRFLSQFRIGSGNYTAQRKGRFQGESVRELAEQIKVRRGTAEALSMRVSKW